MTAIRARGFPRVGVKHVVAHIPAYRKMSVNLEEYDLVMEHRRHRNEEISRLTR